MDNTRNKPKQETNETNSSLDTDPPATVSESGITSELPNVGTGDSADQPPPIDGAKLLDDLVSFCHRFLSLPYGAAEVMALWTVSTHLIDLAEHAPVLVFTSPLPECGKSSALDILRATVANPRSGDNMSPAVMFRLIAQFKPTLIIDEADTFLGLQDELCGILNSGHSPRGSVWRCDGEQHDPREFPTFCPKAIGIIGELPWPALESRSIIIRMQRARPDETLERLSPIKLEELTEVQKRVSTWAKHNLELLKGTDPNMPDGFGGRLADNWRLLFAIADLAGGHWPTTARTSTVAMHGRSEPSSSVILLAAIDVVFREKQVSRISSMDLCEAIRISDTTYAPASLARSLKPFGISPKGIRIGDQTPRGYRIEDFADAFARYLPR